jgi:GH15 family glucan-1,4-alpha-glucosidase
MTSQHPVAGRPIADYALLGDCRGAALVARDGAIEWWCAPRFDSRASLGRLLDPGAGHWTLGPAEPAETTRWYLPDTMVLRTEHRCAGGRLRVTDALAFEEGARGHEIGVRSPSLIVRDVECVDGEVTVRSEYAPRLEYGLTVPALEPHDGAVVTVDGPDGLVLRADRPFAVDGDTARLETTLRAGERLGMTLAWRGPYDPDPAPRDARRALRDTVEGWRSWTGPHTPYEGAYQDLVRRSALVIQAMTYAASGAVVAAPTTSLPEEVGGDKNWDYRFAWLRDASLTMHALWVAACPDEAERHFAWMTHAASGVGDLQIVLGVEGERDLTEHELGHLRGWRDSRPVRIGNAAWRQRQLDVPGEVLASALILRDQIGDMAPRTREFLCSLADIAARDWREPDSGIWEGREGERHYVSSKALCWVALDRALELADVLEAGDERREAWARERDAAREAILDEGWCEAVGAYTGAFGSDRLDASVLLLPMVGFLPADDPRMAATIEAVERELVTDGLVRRWTGAEDGCFILCSFWLADCHARAGDLERAREVFAAAASRANDVGLLAEEVDPVTGEPIGNFPQTISHVGLVSAAWSIERAAGRASREERSTA